MYTLSVATRRRRPTAASLELTDGKLFTYRYSVHSIGVVNRIFRFDRIPNQKNYRSVNVFEFPMLE